jgi:hypothetical protein
MLLSIVPNTFCCIYSQARRRKLPTLEGPLSLVGSPTLEDALRVKHHSMGRLISLPDSKASSLNDTSLVTR